MEILAKRAARAIWNTAFRAAPSDLLSGLTPANLVAPCYHLVSDRPPAHVRHLYECRNINQFKAELDWLLKRFNPVSLEELYSRVEAHEPLPARSLFVSFDDGLRECIDTVAPICRAKGVPVTFFIATGFMGNRSLCYRHKASLLAETYRQMDKTKGVRTRTTTIHSDADFRAFVLQVKYDSATELDECAEQLNLDFDEYLTTERPYLDEDDIAALIHQGFSVGGHSVDHPPYAEIPLDRQMTQTEDCLRDLKTKFPLPVSSFAFPFVADGVSEQFVEKMLSSGSVDLMFYTGAIRPDQNGRVIWRFGVESGNKPLGDTWKSNVGSQQLDRIRSLLTCGGN